MSEDPGHRLVNPDTLPPPVGFSHAVVAAPGRTIFLGGQAGHRADGALVGDSLEEQLDQACANVVAALAAAGGRPTHLVSVQILVTNAGEYTARLDRIGEIWRRHFGRRYPAVTLVEVRGLFDPSAVVELVAIAVIPDEA